jgi:hypothetical protein
MKIPTASQSILGAFLLAAGVLFSSCVDPYYSQNQRQPQHVTTYSAGYEVRSLPSGYRTEMIGGTKYYNHNGTDYRPRSGSYVVVDAPRHYSHQPTHRDVVVRQLPRGYRTVNRGGVRYYQANDVYYQKRGSGYVVVNF